MRGRKRWKMRKHRHDTTYLPREPQGRGRKNEEVGGVVKTEEKQRNHLSGEGFVFGGGGRWSVVVVVVVVRGGR